MPVEMTTQLNTRVCLLMSGFFQTRWSVYLRRQHAYTYDLPIYNTTRDRDFFRVYLRLHMFSGANTHIVFVQFKIIYVRTIVYTIMVYRVHLKVWSHVLKPNARGII